MTSQSSNRPAASLRSKIVLTLCTAACAGLTCLAEGPARKPKHKDGPHEAVTKEGGEEGAVQRRQEWFFRPRQAGAEGRMAHKRFEGVQFARRQEALLATEGTNVWTSRGPASSNFGGWAFGKVAGRIPALAKDWTNDILYVGSASGGAWKSTDDGVSWTSIFDSGGTQTVGAIAVDPSHPTTLWVGTGENTDYWCEDYFGIGLLRSTDGGSTWEIRNGSGGSTLENLSEFCSIQIDPRNSNNLVVGGMTQNCVSGTYSQGGLFTTTDAGATWTKRLTGYVTSIARDPNYPDTLWAGAYYGGVYKSLDNGLTWTQQTASGIPSANCQGRVEVTVAPSNSNYVYALFEYNAAAGHQRPELWRTTDGGASWSQRASGVTACDGQCGYNMTLRVDRTTTETLYRGTIQLFTSTNGGTSWTNLTGAWGSAQKVHQDTHYLLMDPSNSNEFYVGCDGGIWKTNDGGANFTNLNANLNLTQFYDVAIHPTDDGVILGGAQDNSSLGRTTTDTWDLLDVTGDGFMSAINPQNTNYTYIASYPWDDGTGKGNSYPGVERSTTGVKGAYSWITGSGSGIVATDRIEWVTPYTVAPTSGSTLYLGTYRLYKSTNSGTRWTAVGPTDMAGTGYDIFTVNVSRTNANYVYAGTTSHRIWRSTNGFTTYAEISSGLPARTVTDIDPDPANGNLAFCTVSGFGTAHVWEYAGSGSWIARGGGLPDVPANTVLVLNATDIYVGTDVGVFVSTDRGQNFMPFNSGLPQGIVITDIEYNTTTHTMTAGTYGRGAWQITLAAPGEAGGSAGSALKWTGSGNNQLMWGSTLGALGYRIYRGSRSVLSSLPTGASACRAYAGANTITGTNLNAVPAAGDFYWYLAAAYNSAGQGSLGAGTATPRVVNSSGACSPP